MEDLNLLRIIFRGGYLMIPIFICSGIAVAVVVERFLTFRKARVNVGSFMMKIRGALSEDSLDRALRICDETGGPVASIFKVAISRHNMGKEDVKSLVEDAGNAEIYNLENHTGILATIAGVAPLIGFLGTVTGMIRAFIKIQSLGGNVNADVLAGGIWEAMVTTAAGLTVGIFSLIFYNYFVSKIRKLAFEIETNSSELMDMLFSGEEGAIEA